MSLEWNQVASLVHGISPVREAIGDMGRAKRKPIRWSNLVGCIAELSESEENQRCDHGENDFRRHVSPTRKKLAQL
uniref:Uncharacterized protein n=1 Tax=Knipowitschia caucasica TaxID=637954 RepID=A0AAV2ME03_KNICA